MHVLAQPDLKYKHKLDRQHKPSRQLSLLHTTNGLPSDLRDDHNPKLISRALWLGNNVTWLGQESYQQLVRAARVPSTNHVEHWDYGHL